MELKRFKEKNSKKIGIILFTITCILLISGVILYRTFAIFQVNETQNMIEGIVQDMGDVEFAFYIDGSLSKTVPDKKEDYSLDTSTSKCIDMVTGNQTSNINWNNENWSVELKNISTTKTKCYLYFKKIYKETILNGAIPDLGNGRLVPITIKENEKPSEITITNLEEKNYGGKIVKADITDTNNPWYSYTNKKWANAVILRDGKIDDYQPGDEIKESDIESYFVWIPRYKYQLKENENTYNGYNTMTTIEAQEYNNKGLSEVFEITFESKESGITSGNLKGNWLTHPAFTSFNTNGFWVGKFETGYKNAKNSKEAQKNENNSEQIVIKPNVFSWRSIDISHAFYSSYDYIRELESHMLKNTEWGAIAYLAQSKYGRCKNNSCETIMYNNNSNYLTGYASNKQPTCGYRTASEECNTWESTELSVTGTNTYNYFDIRSNSASTTGNYTGVYDMTGGSGERVMGVMQYSENNAEPAIGITSSANTGFNGHYSNETGSKTDGLPLPSKKYYDLYDYNKSDQEYQRGILGDATKETGPFYRTSFHSNNISSYYADSSVFISTNRTWFSRGGHWNYGIATGIMCFLGDIGAANDGQSFRIVLTP